MAEPSDGGRALWILGTVEFLILLPLQYVQQCIWVTSVLTAGNRIAMLSL